MHISTHHQYAARPQIVYDMLRSSDFLSEVAKRVNASQYQVEHDGNNVSLRVTVDSPAKVSKIVGDQMTFVMHVAWGDLVDDSADSKLNVELLKMPGTLTGYSRLRGDSAGTVVDYEADFSLTVPLMRRRLEEMAAPYIRKVIDIQQQVGNDVLANRPS